MKSQSLSCLIIGILIIGSYGRPNWTKEGGQNLPKKKLNPVILVPGDGGSQFEAKLNKPKTVHIWCEQTTDYWFSLWLNIELLAPYVLDCTVDNLRLVYNLTTRSTSNSPGVQIRVPGFGNTSTVEWLDPSQFSLTSYFYHIAEAFVSVGYTRNVNIRGAPYDFRKAPNENREFLANLVKLVEETYEMNDKTPVYLLGHSMGCPYLLYMLNHQSQKWKDKYVKALIAMSGPFAGAIKPLRVMASGDNLGVFVVNPLSARPEQRTMPSSSWVMPSDRYWDKDEVLVYAPLRNYTVKDYKQFFTDIDFMTGYYMWQDTEKLIKDLKPPGVEIHCLYGVNVSTPAGFIYSKSQWYDSQPNVISGDGDGTVNIRSLKTCPAWSSKQKQPVHTQTFPGVDHLGILNHDKLLDYLKNLVSS